jgi:hypothetical protein
MSALIAVAFVIALALLLLGGFAKRKIDDTSRSSSS